MNRRRFLTGAVTTGGGVLVGATAVGLNGSAADPQALLATFIHQERAYNRLPALVGNPGLQLQAELQATRLAVFQPEMRAGAPGVHSPAEEQNWWIDRRREGALGWFGEIVAKGSSSELGLLEVSRAWIRSAPHRAIMLRPEAGLLGVGVRESGDVVWCAAVLGAF